MANPTVALSSLDVRVELSVSDGPPKEFRLLRNGPNKSKKGTFNFTPASAARVMADFQEHGAQLPVDYEHGTFATLSLDKAESSKAAGWFVPEVREDGLWATQLSWTPAGGKKVADKEFRYVSPVFSYDGTTREVQSLHNIALTNMPALSGLTPLMASQQAPQGHTQESPPMIAILSQLGLTANATEAEALAKLSQLQAAQSVVVQLSSLTGQATVPAAMGVVTGWQTEAAKVPALTAQLSELAGAQKRAEVKALVEGALEKKLVTPAQVAVLSQMGETSPEMLKAFLSTLTAPVVGPSSTPAAGTATAILSDTELRAATLFGNDPVALAKHRAEHPHVPMGVLNNTPAK